MKRGQVVWVQLDPVVGHEQGGHRPALVVSDDRFNARTKTVIGILLTSRDKWSAPFQVDLGIIAGKRAFALPGQVRTMSYERLGKVLGSATGEAVDRCLDAMLEICRRRPKSNQADNDA